MSPKKRGRAPSVDRVATMANAKAPAPRPLVYTAQDLARFCEVDLKTIHHWADGGKIAHHRTSGRHLRFRRNDVLAFLRRHNYPVHAELATARPTVFLAVAAPSDPSKASEELVKKLGVRFIVRRFASAIEAVAHLIAGEPDAVVVSAADATLGGARAIAALKASVETTYAVLVVITDRGDDEAAIAMREAGADMVLGVNELGRVNVELTRALAVD